MKSKIWLLVTCLTIAVLAPMMTFNLLDVFAFTHTEGFVNTVDDTFVDVPSKEDDKTTVEYVHGEREIEGMQVGYHLLKIHLASLNDLRSRLATNESGEYGVNIQENMSDIIAKAKEETGKTVLGAVTGDYCFWSTSRKGYVVRNGVVYRTERKSKNSIDLVVKKDKTISFIREGDYSLDVGVGQVSQEFWQIFCFGPVLAKDGAMQVAEDAEINGNTWVNNQRACVGYVDAHNIMFLATEAKNRTSKTLQSFRLWDLGSFLLEQGCVGVYNLDGGYSSGAAYNDEVVFSPTRTIGDIFYVVS